MSRPVPRLNERAFDRAREEFHRVYRRAVQTSLNHSVSGLQEAHDEATGEALMAFLATYEETR